MGPTADERIRVGVADMAVTDESRPLVTSGLGSCVAVVVHDGDGVGGLLHAMLPEAPADVDNPAKYVDSGISQMVADLTRLGGDPNAFVAKVAGGSSMLNLGNGAPVGEKNVVATTEVLAAAGIDVVGSDTGGNAGRSVSFHPTTGTMTIQRVNADPIDL